MYDLMRGTNTSLPSGNVARFDVQEASGEGVALVVIGAAYEADKNALQVLAASHRRPRLAVVTPSVPVVVYNSSDCVGNSSFPDNPDTPARAWVDSRGIVHLTASCRTSLIALR